ncbi:MAG TPA: hypothetical protein PLI09_18660 [Candidatus Hydrogenedentes bacterium]|nr:hypothetical protein [Candidatus Hydrogenedentota bacterium]
MVSKENSHAKHAWLGVGLILLLVLLYGAVLLYTRWLCDDAFITFRVVDNFVHGYGLRWNVVERVQVYTHPLWMLLLTVVYFFSHEVMYTPIALNIVFSLAAVLILGFGIARTTLGSIFALIVLTISRAFVDYSTSGLENPLTYFILALFSWVYFQEDNKRGNIFLLSLVAAFGMVNRMDTALFFFPAMFWSFWRARSRATFGFMLLGLVPFFLWEAFSMVYYGFPFPNSYYAKLGTGIPAWEKIRQGGYYFLDSLHRDPVTLCVCAAGLLFPFALRRWKDSALALGVLLYLAYIVKIGGDFMSGRFFAAPLFCAVLLLSRLQAPGLGWRWAPGFVLVISLAFTVPCSSLFSGKSGKPVVGQKITEHGITDNRRMHGFFESLHLNGTKHAGIPSKQAHEARPPMQWVIAAGATPFQGGPSVHYVDILALTDPLLARLPAVADVRCLVAHNIRTIPGGYFETLCSGENQFADKHLGEFYEHLRVITQDPVFSWVRWKTIASMNMGTFNALIDFTTYRFFSDSDIPESPCPPADRGE